MFNRASVFNRDVSKWNTCAVTTMDGSKCNLSLYGHAFRVVFFLEFHLIIILSRALFFFVFLFFGMILFVIGVWIVLSFFVVSSLAQCLLWHLCSIRACQNGIRVR